MALEKEFKYYIDHQDEIVKKYNGKYVVIVGETVVSSHSTEMEAYLEAKKIYDLGTFLIQKVSPGENSYTQSFRSRVTF